MSHELATQAVRSTRRAAQAIRYTAVVAAGMASIGLTVTAGTYIANHMVGVQHSDSILAAPNSAPGPGPEYKVTGGNAGPGDITPIAEIVDLAAFFGNHPAELLVSPVVPGSQGITAAEAPRPQTNALTGLLRVGDTYLGAQVVPVQRNSLTFTVDTNLFATLADLVLQGPVGTQLGIGGNPGANTQLRTEVDTRRGEVTLTVSDPGIGHYGVQLARHPAPAAAAVQPEAGTVQPETTDTVVSISAV